MNEDLKAYEPAARAYVSALGQDPDQMVSHGAEDDGSGYVPMVLLSSPRWVLAVPTLKRHKAALEALAAHPPA